MTVPPGAYRRPRVSHDGKRVAVVPDQSESTIWIVELDGSAAPRRLTFGGNYDHPVWAPDDSRLAFQAAAGKTLAVYAQTVDGSQPPGQITTPDGGTQHVPDSWSPDGRHLLLDVYRDIRVQLAVADVADKTVRPFGEVESFEPTGAVFSRDGRWVAYASSPIRGGARDANRGVWIQPFPAAGPRYQAPKVGLDFHPVWAPKGLAILYMSTLTTNLLADVPMTARPAPVFGTPVSFRLALTDQVSSGFRDFDILPDGRFIGIKSPDDTVAGSVTLNVVLNWVEELRSRLANQP